MELVLIGVALLAVVIIVVTLLRKPASRPAEADRRAAHAPPAAPAEVHDEAPAAVYSEADVRLAPVRLQPIPPQLANFEPVRADALAGDIKQSIVAMFHNVPRPPRLLHRLLSPDFVGTASSSELEDLIVGEPLIAAKVLATVNSPAFGLKNPVQSLGPAVSYLGLNAVRSICLQYILIDSFKADSPERQRVLDSTWKASALASELIQQLSHKLGLLDQGALVSAVVLSFLGRLASAATMPRSLLETVPSHSLIDRAIAEQETLGLCSSEIGRVLMIDWELPATLIEDAADIDRILVTPCYAIEPVRGGRLALCYLCTRLGERLAEGDLADPAAFDLVAETAPDYFHLRGYFDDMRLEHIMEILRSPELGLGVQKVLQAMQEEPEVQEAEVSLG